MRLSSRAGTAMCECNESDHTQQQHAQQEPGITPTTGRPARRSLPPGGNCKRCSLRNLIEGNAVYCSSFYPDGVISEIFLLSRGCSTSIYVGSYSRGTSSYAPPQHSSALITAATCAAEKCCVAIRYFANPAWTYHAQHWQQHHPLSFVMLAAWLYVACWAGDN